MRAVDTNVLVRILTRDNAHQAAAADAFIAQAAWVSTVALVESIWVLANVYELGSTHLFAAIEMLLSHETLVLQDRELIASALEQYRAKPSIGFSDCVIFEMAKRSGNLPLGTFDRRLAKLDGTQQL